MGLTTEQKNCRAFYLIFCEKFELQMERCKITYFWCKITFFTVQRKTENFSPPIEKSREKGAGESHRVPQFQVFKWCLKFRQAGCPAAHLGGMYGARVDEVELWSIPRQVNDFFCRTFLQEKHTAGGFWRVFFVCVVVPNFGFLIEWKHWKLLEFGSGGSFTDSMNLGERCKVVSHQGRKILMSNASKEFVLLDLFELRENATFCVLGK